MPRLNFRANRWRARARRARPPLCVYRARAGRRVSVVCVSNIKQDGFCARVCSSGSLFTLDFVELGEKAEKKRNAKEESLRALFKLCAKNINFCSFHF